ATYKMALYLGTQLTTPARLAMVVGACATDNDAGNDANCITSFIKTFGERALRRSLSDDDVVFYRGFYAPGDAPQNTIDALGFADVIAGFLMAPQLFYSVEHGEEPSAQHPDVFELSAYELASRLSYHFTQSMPDEQLLAAAANGSLISDENVYASEVSR